MSLLAGDVITVEIQYVEFKNKYGITRYTVLDGIEDIKEKEKKIEKYKDRIKTIKTMWTIPTWEEHQDLVRATFYTDKVTGLQEQDPVLVYKLHVEKHLKGWDIMDSNNNSIPCIPANFYKLDRIIADGILNKFFGTINSNEEELKN